MCQEKPSKVLARAKHSSYHYEGAGKTMQNFWIYGINPVSEALRSGRCRMTKVLVAEGRDPARLKGIIDMLYSDPIPPKAPT